MAHSDLFLSSKLNAIHSAFTTNNYLLKHGNIFVKPEPTNNGYPYCFYQNEIGISGIGGTVQNNEGPLDFVIKHEKPPTPPASTSPVGSKTPPLADEKSATDHSKNNPTWILGKQKLSWDDSTVASYNPETKMFRCVVCNAVGFLSRIAEHYLGTHTSAKVFQCLHCPYSSTWSRCVRMHMAKHHGVPNAPPSLWKGQPLLEEIFQLLTNLKTQVDSQGRDRTDPEVCDKKFICPKCPYTTDRRDLYLRHENIHKEDKPYHCYICFKLFNRADHVKKHFLRIHRGHPYDISLVRRRPPKSGSSAFVSNGKNPIDVSTPKPNGHIPVLNPSDTKNGTYATALKDNNTILPLNAQEFKQAKGFECPFCSWEGADAWCLRRHMNVHIKTHGCPICDFKSSKAERLFTHVYKMHRMLVCTKCKFVTDQANHFENHIKDCCVEIVLGPPDLKANQEDSANESDASNSSGLRRQLETIKAIMKQPNNHQSNHVGKTSNSDDCKASISIIPLHNSVSYCFPAQFNNCVKTFGASNTKPRIDINKSSNFGSNHKFEIKSELASPVQSSSDSGLADLAVDETSVDFTCWDCGCEFANESSLNTHTELHHRTASDTANDKQCKPQRQKNKFSCALCNFSSKEQRTILDHMRFHTGESLICRAEKSCAFTTIFDSTLREHVINEHDDGRQRCPHCGLPCTDRIAFIRHYRQCHHSTSCYRCRDIKHRLSLKRLDTAPSQIQPYLHHNPYSKFNNSVKYYMSTTNAGSGSMSIHEASFLMNNHKERRSRKQSMPRKLVHDKKSTHKRERSRAQANKTSMRKARCRIQSLYKNKYVARCSSSSEQFWYCRKCYKNPLCYKFKTNFLLHNLWYHNSSKFKCKQCSKKFSYKYQILLHKRQFHDTS